MYNMPPFYGCRQLCSHRSCTTTVPILKGTKKGMEEVGSLHGSARKEDKKKGLGMWQYLPCSILQQPFVIFVYIVLATLGINYLKTIFTLT